MHMLAACYACILWAIGVMDWVAGRVVFERHFHLARMAQKAPVRTEPAKCEAATAPASDVARAAPFAAADDSFTLSVHLDSASPPAALFAQPNAYGG